MKELKGQYNTAKVFTDNVEEEAINQIIELLNQGFVKDSIIRIMPDTHAGAGCTIGTTMTITDKIVPNLVGVDIGCGMLTVELGKLNINLEAVDNYIRNEIPSGYEINKEPKTDYKKEIESLKCFRDIPKSAKEFNRALGSLGGGNHFIEINTDKEGVIYLVVHSGSRNLGLQVANYYQKRAIEYHSGLNNKYLEARQNLIDTYKEQGKRKEIQKALIELQKLYIQPTPTITKDLCYVEGDLMKDYLHDMSIMQRYAVINREIMARRIVGENIGLEYNSLNKFQTIHNYIDLDSMILRKGAISAKKDEKVLIPMNMRDGSIIAIGKGNSDWNYSAPHGAGRLMSRTKAKEILSMEDYKQSMKDIFTTSVKDSTLDEAPMAYKPMEEIMENIKDTVEIVKVIKPIYNFKA